MEYLAEYIKHKSQEDLLKSYMMLNQRRLHILVDRFNHKYQKKMMNQNVKCGIPKRLFHYILLPNNEPLLYFSVQLFHEYF